MRENKKWPFHLFGCQEHVPCQQRSDAVQDQGEVDQIESGKEKNEKLVEFFLGSTSGFKD